MFDCHAHRGEKTDQALVCSASPEEKMDLSLFPYHSFGLIPEGGSTDIDLLESRLRDGAFLGEVGIDRRYPDLKGQVQLFRRCLELIDGRDTLVTIHYVGYPDLVASILKEMKVKRFLVHGFTGSLETAKTFERLGGLISISPTLLRAKSCQDILHHTAFVVETDQKTGPIQQLTLQNWVERLSQELNRDIEKESDARFFSFIGGQKVPK